MLADKPNRDRPRFRDAVVTDGARDDAPLLTVIVPVFNEARTIDELLRRVLAAPYSKQVIVVDDGSSDGTVEMLEAYEGHAQIELLQHSRNRGKGAAIRTGLDAARGRFTVIQDADLEYDPQEYALLVEPLLAGQAQVVYGSRYMRRQQTRGQYGSFILRSGVGLLNVAVRLLYGARLTDEATCYKAFPTAVLKAMELECDRFEFCPEVTAKARRMNLSILEVPISYHARSKEDGKKIGMRDGWEALRTLWRWRRWQPDAAVLSAASRPSLEHAPAATSAVEATQNADLV